MEGSIIEWELIHSFMKQPILLLNKKYETLHLIYNDKISIHNSVTFEFQDVSGLNLIKLTKPLPSVSKFNC
jgi:hypothetical protein